MLKKIIIIASFSVLIFSYAESNGYRKVTQTRKGSNMTSSSIRCQNEFIPEWKTGDSWQVEYTFMEPSEVDIKPEPIEVKEIWKYEVMKEGKIGPEKVYRIKISNNRLPFYYYLYIRKDNFTMYSVIEYEGKIRVETKNNYLDNAYLRFEYMERIIFDFGSFCSITNNSKTIVEASEEQPFTQEISFDENRTSMKTTFAGSMYEEQLISEQIWRINDPWWTVASKTIGNKPTISGRLFRGK
jgi:hypothetical protein